MPRTRLIVVTDSPRIGRQPEVTGALHVLGEENPYLGGEWVGRTLRRAHRDAAAWVRERGEEDGRRP